MNECSGPTPPFCSPLDFCPAQNKMQGNSAGVVTEERADRLTAPSRVWGHSLAASLPRASWHTHTHWLLTHTHTHAHTLSLSLSLCRKHTPALSLPYSLTPSPFLSLPLLVSHTYTHRVSHQPSFNSLSATGQQLRQAPCSYSAGKSRASQE